MGKQGRQNKDQKRQQLKSQEGKNDVEFGTEMQVGNSKNQSQKKSGRQKNKK